MQTKHQKQTQKVAAEIKHQKILLMYQMSCIMIQRLKSRAESDTRLMPVKR